jgi:hypothetical protein
MSFRRQCLGPVLAAFSALLVACGGSGSHTPDPEYQKLSRANVEQPATAFERELLSVLPELEAGVRVEVAGGQVIAERAYAAASGRSCRSLLITPPDAGLSRSRLACLVDGAWAFVPDVIAPAGPADEGAAPPGEVDSELPRSRASDDPPGDAP